MIKCNEVSRLIASGRIESAGFWRKFQVKLHLLMCRHCARFARQINRLRQSARRLWGEDLDADHLAEMESRILEALIENNGIAGC